MHTVTTDPRSMAQESGLATGLRSRGLPLWPALTGLCVVLIAAAVLAAGPSDIMAPWDVFILLDGAWRIVVGQVPHTDFANPIGPLAYWVTAIGMQIGEPSLTAYIYGNLLFLAIATPWCGVIFFRKLPGSLAFLLTLFIADLIVAPRPLGYDPSITSYAMIYNRYGWALISMLFVQLFLPDRDPWRHAAAFDATSAGLLLGLLFFSKVNFFVFALAAVLFAIVLRAELRARAVLTAIGFALVCLGFWLAAGINPWDYLRDVASAMQSQSVSHRAQWLMIKVYSTFPQALLIGGIWLYLTALPAVRGQAPWSHAVKTTLIVGFVVGSALAITLGNSGERAGIPLFGVAGIILLDAWRRLQPAAATGPRVLEIPQYGLSLLIVFVVFFGGMVTKDIFSMAKSHRDAPHLASQTFDSPRLRDFFIPANSDWLTAYSRARDVPERINEGLELLRPRVSKQSRVAVLALTNPFSFALGLTPPTGTPLWWDLNMNFDRTNHPDPDRLFSEADFVMYPIVRPGDEGCCQETVAALRELYDDYLNKYYVEAARSPHWVLLQTRG